MAPQARSQDGIIVKSVRSTLSLRMSVIINEDVVCEARCLVVGVRFSNWSRYYVVEVQSMKRYFGG